EKKRAGSRGFAEAVRAGLRSEDPPLPALVVIKTERISENATVVWATVAVFVLAGRLYSERGKCLTPNRRQLRIAGARECLWVATRRARSLPTNAPWTRD